MKRRQGSVDIAHPTMRYVHGMAATYRLSRATLHTAWLYMNNLTLSGFPTHRPGTVDTVAALSVAVKINGCDAFDGPAGLNKRTGLTRTTSSRRRRVIVSFSKMFKPGALLAAEQVLLSALGEACMRITPLSSCTAHRFGLYSPIEAFDVELRTFTSVVAVSLPWVVVKVDNGEYGHDSKE